MIKRVHSIKTVPMKQIQIFFLFLVFCFSVAAQNTGNDAASIRAQMSAIRKSTNWSDPAAAKTANAKIQELAAKLTSALRQNKAQTLPPGSEVINPEEGAKIQQENDDYSNKLWNQMMKIVQEGGQGKWDLAEPLREEIAAEYKEDESLKVVSPEFLEEMTYLCINMSMPGVQMVIDQMENYKSIKILLITGGKNGAPVDLESIISKAANYPLQRLYIINFRNFVTKIPKSVANFPKLTSLMLYNNQISQLPPELSSLNSLKKFCVDINPLVSLTPAINNMNALDTLGIAKTQITEAEINRIKTELPNCKILLK